MTAPNLEQLAQELAAQGVAVPNGLGWDEEHGVYTYGDAPQTFERQVGVQGDGTPLVETQTVTVSGAILPLPPEAAPVVAAHVPRPVPDPVVQADLAAFQAIQSATTIAALKAALIQWMQGRPGVNVPKAGP